MNPMNLSTRKIQMRWIISIETEKQTTSKLIQEYFSRKLNETNELVIEVRHLTNKKLDLSENKILLAWTPGIFTKESVSFKKELQENRILLRIFEQPNIYNFYFFNKMLEVVSKKSNQYFSYAFSDFGIHWNLFFLESKSFQNIPNYYWNLSFS